MAARCEKLLALSLAAGFLAFFLVCSCEKENLVEPLEFFDTSNPEKWEVCLSCGSELSPVSADAPPPETENICTGANPTSGPLCIQYVLTAETEVSLAVYSPRGRLIKDLVREIQPAGTRYLYWDLTDTEGSAVPDGVYRAYYKAGGNVIHGDIIVDR
ncbi:MAG: hypothetical protein JW952_06060 [Candidatus Eisenbacteria bacterium]|nr:hypothetical protein [Candidatus Eisenbacteria bacterium]